MATITIRPTSISLGGSNLTPTGGSPTNTVVANLSDALDSSYVTTTGTVGIKYNTVFGLGTPTISNNDYVARLEPVMRWKGGGSNSLLEITAANSFTWNTAGPQANWLTGSLYTSTTLENNSSNLTSLALGWKLGSGSPAFQIADIWLNIKTITKAYATPLNTTMTTSNFATIPVEVAATIDWETSTLLRTVIVELRVEQGGITPFTGTLVSSTTAEVVFSATGTQTVNVTLPDVLADGTYRVYARATRYRDGQSQSTALSYSAQRSSWVSGDLTMSVTPPSSPVMTRTVDQTLDRIGFTVTPQRSTGFLNYKLVIERSTDMSTWSPIRAADDYVLPLRTNLCPNPNLSAGVSSWQGVGGASIAGTGMMNITKAAAPNSGAAFFADNVTPGVTYTAYAWVDVPAAPTGETTNVKPVVSWYNGATYLGGTSGTVVPIAPGPNGQIVSITATAIAGSTRAFFAWGTSAAETAGKIFRIDYALAEAASTVQPYFDGASQGTWTGAANASTSVAVDHAPLSFYDYESPRGVTVWHRARISATLNGAPITSGPSGLLSSLLSADGWNLKVPETSALNVINTSVVGTISENINEDLGVFRPLDRRFPVIDAGTMTGWDGELRLNTSTASEWSAIQDVIEAQKVLLLESPFGWSKYIRIVNGAKVSTLGTPTAPFRSVTMSYVETDSP